MREEFNTYIELANGFKAGLHKYKNEDELLSHLKRRGGDIEYQTQGITEGPLGSAFLREILSTRDPLALTLKSYIFIEHFVNHIIENVEASTLSIFEKLKLLKKSKVLSKEVLSDLEVVAYLHKAYLNNPLFDFSQFDVSQFTYFSDIYWNFDPEPQKAETKYWINFHTFVVALQLILMRITEEYPSTGELQEKDYKTNELQSQ
ncbi:MAG: hypothetical protein M3Q44_04095 [bacterium]|nr:hypothetical protein [bacterium]